MPTINNIVDDTLSMLRGYVRNQEQVTYLSTDISSSVTSFNVGNGTRISPGRIEVGEEIMEVDSVDANTITLFPFGRGADGSTASAHSANARIVASPLFPRARVKQSVMDQVRQVANIVPGVATHEFTFDAGTYSFNLPSDVSQVLRVIAERPGLTNTWERVTRYKVEKQADPTDFAGANSIAVFDKAWPGKAVRVTYSKIAPASMASSTDITTDLGIQQSCRDVIALGATAHLLAPMDVASLDPSSIQALFVDEKRQPGSSVRLVAQLWALYRERLDEERQIFNRQNPINPYSER